MADEMEGARPARLSAAGPRLSGEHKGWYVPGALPHFDSADVVQAITFRLADALPRDLVMARRDEATTAHRGGPGRLSRRMPSPRPGASGDRGDRAASRASGSNTSSLPG